MFLRNAFFSEAILIAVCSACASTHSTPKPDTTTLSPEQENLANIDNQIKMLQKKRDYCKARLYEDTDEAMRTEFDSDWETYEGNLGKQEYVNDKLNQLNAQIEELEKKKEALQGKK